MNVSIDRWRIRNFEPTDRQALVKYANNENVALHLRDRFPAPYTDADARLWLANVAMQARRTHFAIADDDELIGVIGVEMRGDVYRQSAELGYWIGEPHWGQGIATLAVGVVADWAFAELPIVRLWASVFEINPASGRVLEKNGFVCEGRLRLAVTKGDRVMDELIYARTKW